MRKISLITILVIASITIACNSYASVGDIVDLDSVEMWAEGGLLKVRFTVLQDFKVGWEKVEGDMIYHRSSNSTLYIHRASTDISLTGTCGLLVNIGELDGIPTGSYEVWYYANNTYETYVTGWGCAYSGCVVPYDFVPAENLNETHYISFKTAPSLPETYVYYSIPVPPVEHTYVSISHDSVSNVLGYSTELLGDIGGPVAMVMGIPAGLWVIWQIFGLFKRRD